MANETEQFRIKLSFVADHQDGNQVESFTEIVFNYENTPLDTLTLMSDAVLRLGLELNRFGAGIAIERADENKSLS